MAVTPNKIIYPQSQKTACAVCTAAKTTYNDTANAVLLLTAGTDGAILTALTAIPRATVTATQLQLFLSPDGGTTLYFINSALMGAYTMANTTQAAPTDFGYTAAAPLRLGPGDRLYVGTAVALTGGIVFSAQYQDY
jgi:hypothetical protein